MMSLVRSETTKLLTGRATWILALVTVFGTWPMAWTNAVPIPDGLADSDLLFSSTPIPVEYQGLDMAGIGYVLVVALASLWAGSEYGGGNQIRTTILATPKRLRVFIVKAMLLAVLTGAIGFVTMAGTMVITHLASPSTIDPWTLTPTIWANVGGVALAWTLTALIAFSIGVLARTAILPLMVMTPLVIGIGDFLASFWSGAQFLPTVAGAALYSDPAGDSYLDPALGGIVQASWAAVLLVAAAVSFTRRDL
ncbi:MAG: hypothetical protein KA158_09205 [Leucobacter sp.]|nr:hypothetical protein [Leucobacter sp.]